ncbi:MAG: Xaa-Pro peptidase family protein [Chloroflexota bacterium]|nr:Xaa-Pro peptidase family protein [Chloroflexota bacterium]
MERAEFAISAGSGQLVEPLPFSDIEYGSRLAALRREMDRLNADAFVSFTPENIYYLTGHDTPGYYFYQACVVTSTGPPVNVLRRIESTNTLWRSWGRRAVIYEDREDPVAATLWLLRELGVANGTVALEGDSFFVTPRRHADLAAGIKQAGGSTVAAQLVEPLRLLKSAEEIAYLRTGAQIVTTAMRAAVAASREGVTENDVAAEMLAAMVRAGGEYAGLPPFITSGPRTSLCHATWGGRTLVAGDVLAYELPGVFKRYAAPLFRCGTVGPPADDVRALADACRGSLEAVIAAIRPGASSGEVHEASRGNFERAGFGDLLGHRTGYSVGINYPPDWGEGHILSIWAGDDRPLEPGMALHLVPGIFVPGRYLIVISDTVLVTPSGCEVLTDFPRDLFEAPRSR